MQKILHALQRANDYAADIVFTVSVAAHGFSPELSYGSHMFQDLVEENILYCAALENSSTTFNRGVLDSLPQVELETAATDPDVASCVRLLDARERGLELWHDLMSGQTLIAYKK